MSYRAHTLIGLLAAVLTLASGPAVSASVLSVHPVRLQLVGEQRSTSLRVENPGDERITVEIAAQAWSQQQGADVLHDTDDLIVNPALFFVDPGQVQVVRVGLRTAHADRSRELSYRLYFTEVRPARRAEETGLRLVLRVGVPLFVRPRQPAAALTFSVSGKGHDAVLHVRNDGNAHARLLRLEIPDGEAPRSVDTVGDILAGSVRDFPLRGVNIGALGGRNIRAITDTGPLDALVHTRSD